MGRIVIEPDAPIRLGLVGRGRWGANIERTLRAFPDVVVDILPRDAAVGRVHGVLIATPSATHADVALPYIERGIPTFIEKPLATTIADAERIRDAAEQAGVLVFVGHVQLYNPAFRAACEQASALGSIRYILCEGANASPRTDASVLWDWLPHHLSMARMLTGKEPSSVTAWRLTGSSPTTAAVSRFLFGDIPVVCTTSWLSPIKRQSMTVVAEKGTLVFDDTSTRKIALHGTTDGVSFPEYEAEQPLTVELRHFCDLVHGVGTAQDRLEAGTIIVQAIAAAERSADTDGASIALRYS